MNAKSSLVLISFILLFGFVWWLKSNKDFSNAVSNDASFSNLSQLQSYDLSSPLDASIYHIGEPFAELNIVHFWATWCGPCVEEYPGLIQLGQTYGAAVRIWVVSLDNSDTDVQNFVKAFPAPGKSVQVLIDKEGVLSSIFTVSKIPETFVFNSRGQFIQKFSGSMNWQSVEMDQFIKKYLKNK